MAHNYPQNKPIPAPYQHTHIAHNYRKQLRNYSTPTTELPRISHPAATPVQHSPAKEIHPSTFEQ